MASLDLMVEIQSCLHLQGNLRSKTADSSTSSGSLYQTERRHRIENNAIVYKPNVTWAEATTIKMRRGQQGPCLLSRKEKDVSCHHLSEPLRHHFVLMPRKQWVEKPPDNREHPIRDVTAYHWLLLSKQEFLTHKFINVSICIACPVKDKVFIVSGRYTR
jgi:hypothetical protein